MQDSKTDEKDPREVLEALEMEADYRDMMVLVKERYEKGKKKYGTGTFLKKDMVSELDAEFADSINYFAFEIVKLKRKLLELKTLRTCKTCKFFVKAESKSGFPVFPTGRDSECNKMLEEGLLVGTRQTPNRTFTRVGIILLPHPNFGCRHHKERK